MIDLLNKWMLESTGNFNIVVGLTALLFLGSVIALIIIYKKLVNQMKEQILFI